MCLDLWLQGCEGQTQGHRNQKHMPTCSICNVQKYPHMCHDVEHLIFVPSYTICFLIRCLHARVIHECQILGYFFSQVMYRKWHHRSSVTTCSTCTLAWGNESHPIYVKILYQVFPDKISNSYLMHLLNTTHKGEPGGSTFDLCTKTWFVHTNCSWFSRHMQ